MVHFFETVNGPILASFFILVFFSGEFWALENSKESV